MLPFGTLDTNRSKISCREGSRTCRVTRLGELSPWAIVFFGQFFNYIRILNVGANFFHQQKLCTVFFILKNWLAEIVAIFFTNSSGHPAGQQKLLSSLF
jgi:hypothetical protein